MSDASSHDRSHDPGGASASPADPALAYMPMDRRQAAAGGAEVPERARGVALFADISGFTPLSEAIEHALGARRGGEELTRHLNRVYGALIHQVHRFGGSVIGFSGDAITCWFHDDDGQRATTCGLGLHAAMQEHGQVRTPSGDTHDLSIKVAATGGLARRLLVGSPQVQVIDVLAGSLLDRLARLEAATPRGALVVGPELQAALPGDAAVERWIPAAEGERGAVIGALESRAAPAPWPALEPGALGPEVLRPWLLPPVWERLQGGHGGDLLAELRPAVALFLRFGGLDYDDDDAVGEKLDAYVCWTQQVLQRYEGSLVQLTTGDKGSYLYAVFGAPVAHEDDTARALAAASILRRPPPELSFIERVQLGMSRGRMRTGGYGSPTRRTYGALGDETNVAARLMSKAEPGQLLITRRVATIAEAGGLRCTPLGSVALKGKREPLEVFACTGRPRPARGAEGARRRSQEAVVGRTRERALLHAAVDRLHGAGEGGVVVVEGEAGIGKSTLLEDLLEYAETKADPALQVLTARADALEHSTAYYAWRAVYARLLGLESEPEDIEAHVRARLPPAMRRLAPLLSAVVDVDPGDATVDPRLSPSLRAASLPRYLAGVFTALVGGASSRTLLVVEDVHWLDSSSRTLLRLILDADLSLLAVGSTRPLDPPPEAYYALLRRPTTLHLPLEAMVPEDALALVHRRLGVTRVPERLAALIQDKAEGNPFFGEELVRALCEAGLVRVEQGECVIEEDGLGELDFPDTIEGVVTSRIDRLAPSQQFTLKVASVLGRAFALRTLHDVLPGAAERERLEGDLQRLTEVALTTCEAPAPEARYLFKHAITRDVAYNLMLFEQRRGLHHVAADWYERVSAEEQASSYYPLIAHHRVKAIEGDADAALERVHEAVVALARASGHALQSSATPEALAQATAGLELLERLPEGRERNRLELELRSVVGAGMVLVGGPTHEQVRVHFDRARWLCRELGETAQLFEAVFGIWYFNFIRADREGTLTFLQRLLEIAESAGIPAMRSRAQEARGCVLICEGRYTEALPCMSEAIALASQTPSARAGVAQSRDPVVIAYSYRAWAQWFLGYPQRAMADVRQSIALAERVDHPLAMAQALGFGAHVQRYRRKVDAVVDLATRGGAICEEHGFLMWLAGNRAAMGWVALERGELELSAVKLEAALAMAEQLELGIISMVARSDLIDAYTRLGRLDDALGLIERAKTIQRDLLSGFCEPEILRLEGLVWQQRGDPERAQTCLETALQRARAEQMRSLELRVGTALGRLWHATGRGEAARELLTELVGWFREGRDSPDMHDARAVLDQLGASG